MCPWKKEQWVVVLIQNTLGQSMSVYVCVLCSMNVWLSKVSGLMRGSHYCHQVHRFLSSLPYNSSAATFRDCANSRYHIRTLPVSSFVTRLVIIFVCGFSCLEHSLVACLCKELFSVHARTQQQWLSRLCAIFHQNYGWFVVSAAFLGCIVVHVSNPI